MTLFNGDGTASSLQPLRIYDNGSREIFSDDVNNGGLARPWLAMLPRRTPRSPAGRRPAPPPG